MLLLGLGASCSTTLLVSLEFSHLFFGSQSFKAVIEAESHETLSPAESASNAVEVAVERSLLLTASTTRGRLLFDLSNEVLIFRAWYLHQYEKRLAEAVYPPFGTSHVWFLPFRDSD